MKEALLEPMLRRMRLARVMPVLRRLPGCRLLDIGCGWEASLLAAVEPHVQHAVGIDLKAPRIATPRLTTIAAALADELPFPDASFDVVTMLGVLEHLSHPRAIVEEIARVLRPDGQLVLTVPSPRAKPVLEFLAYRVGLVSEAEIRDHKRYYDRRSLGELLQGSGLVIVRHRSFQLGMNNLLVANREVTGCPSAFTTSS
jgi:2-polyprenyl-3-methyl-5-hydroxy-6-metoxy-1,4-benzoquinol methylase